MAFKVKEGKESTHILGITLGEGTQEDLKRLFESGDTRFIELIADPPEEKKKSRSSKKAKDKELSENES